jgi:hypothetical protein
MSRVLVVMPNGFGLAPIGKELPPERRAFGAVLSADARGQDIAAAGVRAVRRLAAVHGAAIEAGLLSKGGGSGERLIVAGAAVAAAVAAFAAVLLRRRRVRPGQPGVAA